VAIEVSQLAAECGTGPWTPYCIQEDEEFCRFLIDEDTQYFRGLVPAMPMHDRKIRATTLKHWRLRLATQWLPLQRSPHRVAGRVPLLRESFNRSEANFSAYSTSASQRLF
jgi:hypothetical protein